MKRFIASLASGIMHAKDFNRVPTLNSIYSMSSLITLLSIAPPPVTVPDLGSTGVLLGLGVLAIGAVARLVKNKKR